MLVPVQFIVMLDTRDATVSFDAIEDCSSVCSCRINELSRDTALCLADIILLRFLIEFCISAFISNSEVLLFSESLSLIIVSIFLTVLHKV